MRHWLWTALLCPVLAGAADAPRALMAVVSKGLPGIALYDAATDALLCQKQLDPAPHEAAFSSDGRTLYVPIYSTANIGQPGPDGHTIEFLRTSDCSVEATLDLGDVKRPHYIELGRSGLLYVTAEQNQSILVVDPKQRRVTGLIPTGSNQTHFFSLTRDERQIFTSNIGDRSISVLDVRGKRLFTSINIGSSNQRMTLSPDEKWFVTNLWQSGKIAFYRVQNHQLDFEVPVEGAPFVARFSPDGKFLYDMGTPPRGAGPGGIRVWKIDLARRTVVATSTDDLGQGTGSLQVNPVNRQIYLTAYSGKISVLDPDTLKLVRQIDAPATPDGLFFSRVK